MHAITEAAYQNLIMRSSKRSRSLIALTFIVTLGATLLSGVPVATAATTHPGTSTLKPAHRQTTGGNMKAKQVVSAAVLTVVVGATVAATTASADASGSGTDVAPATSSEKVTTAQASDVSIAACWTTFNPSAPNGAPMDQTYVNCNTSGIYVASGYIYQGQVNLGGQIACNFVSAGGSITWHWYVTQPGATYTTVNCRYPA
jgi:hypothetical protein